MCTVSMVIGDWTDRHSPNFLDMYRHPPTPDLALKMLEVIQRLDEIDKRLGLLDCKVKEPEKEIFIRKLRELADQLENEPVQQSFPPK